MLPDYKWLTAEKHTEETGVPPERWADYQAIAGDTTDGIKGAPGIGAKGAATLLQTFGSLEAVLEAASASGETQSGETHKDERLREKQIQALLQLREKLDVTRKLVTLVTDLPISVNTRII